MNIRTATIKDLEAVTSVEAECFPPAEAATREELAYIKETTLKINELLKEFFLSMNLKLVDFKIEFGKTADGTILLADEISPDSCRLWDVNTNQKYDKDVFRQDIGDLIETYKAVLARMQNK